MNEFIYFSVKTQFYLKNKNKNFYSNHFLSILDNYNLVFFFLKNLKEEVEIEEE
jgi:hypothetical protein